ncbi:Hachiman antiphage defense system protein HamA [Pseudomonas sp. IPO3775]|jgi:hypothetical protein|uniref:Hachiman antiphage defense system protein HamA n=1 Tax=Pseudomonas sp. IPO3775 TaxID=2738827 RepID=UPI0015A4CC30|nr:Hachiman antiphage defense system protein HamA [Pseudomonas sp. IPO3775]NVZ16940.1 DUF1837 domain-containing protein [Pseudomonas sp. IPO3775]
MIGVIFNTVDEYAMCCVERLSDELKETIKENLSLICHGAQKVSRGKEMYKYGETIKGFWERYSSKPANTKTGMLGELLAHVIILKFFPDFEVASAFFNLEERSIKKGFDLILFKPKSKNVWITEVKSGQLHASGTSCTTTTDLLSTARDDLKRRLSEQQSNHWLNAVNTANAAILNKSNYKDLVIDILEDEGALVAKKSATCKDNNVFLVSALFHDISQKIKEPTILQFSKNLSKAAHFKSTFVLSLHKGTLKKLEAFMKKEAKLYA